MSDVAWKIIFAWDRYGGVVASTSNFAVSPDSAHTRSVTHTHERRSATGDDELAYDDIAPLMREFSIALELQLREWQTMGVRGVWFRVCVGETHCVCVLHTHGFTFHHAKDDYVMLTRWLPTHEPNLLPAYASTYVGVGGLVLNEQGHMLVVAERYAHDHTLRWKLPGGHVERGERLSAAVEREVREETGLHAEFQALVLARHNVRYLFGCSDLYIVCLLRAQGDESLHADADEIAACRWMPVQDFLADPNVYHVNKQIVSQCLLQAARGVPMVRQFADHMMFNNRPVEFDVYRVDVDAEKQREVAKDALHALAAPETSDSTALLTTAEIRELLGSPSHEAANLVRTWLGKDGAPARGVKSSSTTVQRAEEKIKDDARPAGESTWLVGGSLVAGGVLLGATLVVAFAKWASNTSITAATPAAHARVR